MAFHRARKEKEEIEAREREALAAIEAQEQPLFADAEPDGEADGTEEVAPQ
jgi:hypothetical protein